MPLTCTKCQRLNPVEATYCYFDGNLLPGQKARGPINVGSRPFPAEFVFPSGRRCRNFDELGLGCLQEWNAAVQLLQEGYLESFLAGIGRADLAMMARQIAKFPDRDRALDMLLERLPSQVVEPPKLHVEPLFINLGQMKVGEDRRFDLHISNQGMRLVYGTITLEKTGWLALGELPGVPEKSFQTDQEVVIPVLVRGKQLKASKGLEGKILVGSNGGAAEVVVKVEVPVRTFPSGILAGARKQRELAERAYRSPKEAAPLFESGAVAKWYKDNNWAYPVQGPPASGLAALQQFFEACGLTQPPKVEIDTAALTLNGSPGDRVEQTIRVTAQEKKPVYAYATSDQPWLTVGPAALNGMVASLPIVVPSVPEMEGAATALLTVIANGRQKFRVPVTLQVSPGFRFAQPDATFAFDKTAAAGPGLASTVEGPAELFSDREPDPLKSFMKRDTRQWLHALPAALLLLSLATILLIDWHKRDTADGSVPHKLGTAPEKPPEDFTEAFVISDKDYYVQIDFSDVAFHRFGISLPKSQGKGLTYKGNENKGKTSNTCLRIDGQEFIFGKPPGVGGKDHRDPRKPIEEPLRLPNGPNSRRWRSVWEYPDQGIRVRQDVSIRPGEQSGKLDTCLVRYLIEHIQKDSPPAKVGLRVLLDTFIGGNDGVPFTVPGRRELVDTMLVFKTADDVPDFLQALERPGLQDPGTIAHLTLRLDKLEPPSRVTLGAWPNPDFEELREKGALAGETGWDVPLASIKQFTPPDSAVVMYWEEKELQAGERREMGFAYGLGSLASTGEGSGKIALTVGGNFRPGKEFTATAYVSEPLAGQKLTLELPDGLQLEVDENATKAVPPARAATYSQVSWRIKSLRAGRYKLTVQSSTRVSQSQEVVIRTSSIFD